MEESLLDEVEEENETAGRVSVGAEVTVENAFKWLSSRVITKIWQKVKEKEPSHTLFIVKRVSGTCFQSSWI